MLDLRQSPFYLDENQERWIYKTLEKMTVEEKAGQLFCVMDGDYEPETLKELVRTGRVGGILFRPAPAV